VEAEAEQGTEVALKLAVTLVKKPFTPICGTVHLIVNIL